MENVYETMPESSVFYENGSIIGETDNFGHVNAISKYSYGNHEYNDNYKHLNGHNISIQTTTPLSSHTVISLKTKSPTKKLPLDNTFCKNNIGPANRRLNVIYSDKGGGQLNCIDAVKIKIDRDIKSKPQHGNGCVANGKIHHYASDFCPESVKDSNLPQNPYQKSKFFSALRDIDKLIQLFRTSRENITSIGNVDNLDANLEQGAQHKNSVPALISANDALERTQIPIAATLKNPTHLLLTTSNLILDNYVPFAVPKISQEPQSIYEFDSHIHAIQIAFEVEASANLGHSTQNIGDIHLQKLDPTSGQFYNIFPLPEIQPSYIKGTSTVTDVLTERWRYPKFQIDIGLAKSAKSSSNRGSPSSRACNYNRTVTCEIYDFDENDIGDYRFSISNPAGFCTTKQFRINRPVENNGPQLNIEKNIVDTNQSPASAINTLDPKCQAKVKTTFSSTSLSYKIQLSISRVNNLYKNCRVFWFKDGHRIDHTHFNDDHCFKKYALDAYPQIPTSKSLENNSPKNLAFANFELFRPTHTYFVAQYLTTFTGDYMCMIDFCIKPQSHSTKPECFTNSTPRALFTFFALRLEAPRSKKTFEHEANITFDPMTPTKADLSTQDNTESDLLMDNNGQIQPNNCMNANEPEEEVRPSVKLLIKESVFTRLSVIADQPVESLEEALQNHGNISKDVARDTAPQQTSLDGSMNHSCPSNNMLLDVEDSISLLSSIPSDVFTLAPGRTMFKGKPGPNLNNGIGDQLKFSHSPLPIERVNSKVPSLTPIDFPHLPDFNLLAQQALQQNTNSHPPANKNYAYFSSSNVEKIPHNYLRQKPLHEEFLKDGECELTPSKKSKVFDNSTFLHPHNRLSMDELDDSETVLTPRDKLTCAICRDNPRCSAKSENVFNFNSENIIKNDVKFLAMSGKNNGILKCESENIDQSTPPTNKSDIVKKEDEFCKFIKHTQDFESKAKNDFEPPAEEDIETIIKCKKKDNTNVIFVSDNTSRNPPKSSPSHNYSVRSEEIASESPNHFCNSHNDSSSSPISNASDKHRGSGSPRKDFNSDKLSAAQRNLTRLSSNTSLNNPTLSLNSSLNNCSNCHPIGDKIIGTNNQKYTRTRAKFECLAAPTSPSHGDFKYNRSSSISYCPSLASSLLNSTALSLPPDTMSFLQFKEPSSCTGENSFETYDNLSLRADPQVETGEMGRWIRNSTDTYSRESTPTMFHSQKRAYNNESSFASIKMSLKELIDEEGEELDENLVLQNSMNCFNRSQISLPSSMPGEIGINDAKRNLVVINKRSGKILHNKTRHQAVKWKRPSVPPPTPPPPPSPHLKSPNDDVVPTNPSIDNASYHHDSHIKIKKLLELTEIPNDDTSSGDLINQSSVHKIAKENSLPGFATKPNLTECKLVDDTDKTVNQNGHQRHNRKRPVKVSSHHNGVNEVGVSSSSNELITKAKIKLSSRLSLPEETSRTSNKNNCMINSPSSANKKSGFGVRQGSFKAVFDTLHKTKHFLDNNKPYSNGNYCQSKQNKSKLFPSSNKNILSSPTLSSIKKRFTHSKVYNFSSTPSANLNDDSATSKRPSHNSSFNIIDSSASRPEETLINLNSTENVQKCKIVLHNAQKVDN